MDAASFECFPVPSEHNQIEKISEEKIIVCKCVRSCLDKNVLIFNLILKEGNTRRTILAPF